MQLAVCSQLPSVLYTVPKPSISLDQKQIRTMAAQEELSSEQTRCPEVEFFPGLVQSKAALDAVAGPGVTEILRLFDALCCSLDSNLP